MPKQLLLVCNHPKKGRCILDKQQEGQSVFFVPRNTRSALNFAVAALNSHLPLTNSIDFGEFGCTLLTHKGVRYEVVDYHPCDLSSGRGECSFSVLEAAGFTFTPEADHPVFQAKKRQASAKPKHNKPLMGFVGSLLPRLSLA